MGRSLPRSASKSRFTFFNYTFWPSDSATAVLLASLTRRIARHHDVVAVCANPGELALPSMDGIRAVRIVRFTTSLAPKRILTRCLDYLQYLLRASAYLLTAPDPGVVVLCSEPPFVDTWLGLLCLWRRFPYFIVVHDFYPDFALHGGILRDGWIYRAIRRATLHVFRRARQVICVSEDSRGLLESYEVRNVVVIDHWIEPDEIRPLPSVTHSGRPLVLGYAGNLGNACDLDVFCRAIEQLPNRHRFRFEFFASGFKLRRLRQWATSFDCVRIHGWVPRARLSESLAECDALLILTPPRQLGCVWASKFYTILASARPVVASLPSGSAMHRLIQRLGVGFSVPGENPGRLACLIEELAELKAQSPEVLPRMGAIGRRYVETEWNGERAALAYLSVFETEMGWTPSTQAIEGCAHQGSRIR